MIEENRRNPSAISIAVDFVLHQDRRRETLVYPLHIRKRKGLLPSLSIKIKSGYLKPSLSGCQQPARAGHVVKVVHT